MLENSRYVFAKVLVILIIVLVYYLINKYGGDTLNKIESFEDKIEKEKYNYLKLKETYIEPKGTTLKLLYTNYSGEELDKDYWENKTLDQCIDTCNKIENCVGFNRDLVLDTEPAKCYPRSSVQKCHSNRKGTDKQMSKSIKYNSYIKSTVPNIINTCIGDSELTLNRIIFIKSYSLPNQYIGYNDDSRVVMIDKNISQFTTKCSFRLEAGKDGVGTVSFLHINTNKYLYRNNDNTIILKDINTIKTEDKQRSSFNMHDGISNGIMFKAMLLDGETTNKFITLDTINLKIATINNNKNNNTDNDNDKIKQQSTFYIVDNIIESNIITNKNNIPIQQPHPPQATLPQATLPQATQPQATLQQKENFISSINNAYNSSNKLDTTDKLPIYSNLFNSDNEENLSDYLNDNYLKNTKNNYQYMSISKKYNNIILQKALSESLTKNQDEYNSIKQLNQEIENEIANNNIDLNAKNDTIINQLDKLRITDLSNDYFFLNNIVKN